jgi:hypothetical protein
LFDSDKSLVNSSSECRKGAQIIATSLSFPLLTLLVSESSAVKSSRRFYPSLRNRSVVDSRPSSVREKSDKQFETIRQTDKDLTKVFVLTLLCHRQSFRQTRILVTNVFVRQSTLVSHTPWIIHGGCRGLRWATRLFVAIHLAARASVGFALVNADFVHEAARSGRGTQSG